RGYPRQYSAALLGISSLLGILIPPSITMLLFAVVTQQSVVACFAATIGPGILLMVGLTLFNYVVAGRWFKELPAQPADEQSRRASLKTLLYAVPALCIPALILGGIYGGVFTPTEAAAVAVVLVIGLGCFV